MKLILLGTKLIILFFLFIHFTCTTQGENKRYANETRIKQDLQAICKTDKSRNFKNIETLNQVAEYIFNEFFKTCDTVYFQSFYVNGVEYKNVIGSIGLNKPERVIVGAHYDVEGNQEGADDNASGVVGLLELSRIISKNEVPNRIDFVAYTLEEPPFFRSTEMGSYVHAKYLHDYHIKIKGMICLEMLGYFSDDKKSQDYPVGMMSWFYGNKGDYIAVVQNFGNGSFGKKLKRLMKKSGIINTKSIKAPTWVQGIDFSDHLNYWKFGFSAVMITDTAFYRNKNYHKSTDTVETLDIKRMALVIDEVYVALKGLN